MLWSYPSLAQPASRVGAPRHVVHAAVSARVPRLQEHLDILCVVASCRHLQTLGREGHDGETGRDVAHVHLAASHTPDKQTSHSTSRQPCFDAQILL